MPPADARTTLSATQEMFVAWNAQRLGISRRRSRDRYLRSIAAFSGGARQVEYREFCLRSYELFQVFSDDSPGEVFAAYQRFAELHFLRQLSYREPQWRATHPMVCALAARDRVVLLDFGCGTAAASRALALYLAGRGVEVRLHLADIPTIRKDFLLWWGRTSGIPTTFVDCGPARPRPRIKGVDLCFATEVFEHLHDPMPALRWISGCLGRAGILVTDVRDHQEEFMHVRPKLGSLRRWLLEHGYAELHDHMVFRKHAAGAAASSAPSAAPPEESWISTWRDR
jgi:SAM-dependent methyltransferase